MANRWQMAKAFGRAMMEPIKAKDAGKVRDEVGTIAKKLDDGPRNAYGEGVTEGFNDLGRTIQFEKKRKIPEIRKRMDELSDEATDKSLQSEFDEEIDRALKGAANRQYKTNNRGDRLGTVTNIEDDFREQAIEMLKEGRPIEDVLDILKQTGYQRPKLGRVSSGE